MLKKVNNNLNRVNCTPFSSTSSWKQFLSEMASYSHLLYLELKQINNFLFQPSICRFFDLPTSARLYCTRTIHIINRNFCRVSKSEMISCFTNAKFVSYSSNRYDNDKANTPETGYSTNLCDTEQELVRKPDSVLQLQFQKSLLQEILEYGPKKFSSWVLERKLKLLCRNYSSLSEEQKKEYIEELAIKHSINHEQVYQTAKSLLDINQSSVSKLLKMEEQLRNTLMPQYMWLFFHIGKLEKGVKFLVDLRTDVLNLIAEKSAENSRPYELEQLNSTLRELLSMWFSIGFLLLERVTWKSSCEMLQKISEYEAVHPVRNWTDLKRRVGPYRRCFIFTHNSMPGEPLVVLHTALADKISSSVNDLVSAKSFNHVDEADVKNSFNDSTEDTKNVKAGVFYSITSTQKGLQGIELGNYLIKRVVSELQAEFPRMEKFSSLSPIPSFRTWLLEKLKNAQRGNNDILTENEIVDLQNCLNSNDVFEDLRKSLNTNAWLDSTTLNTVLQPFFMRNCARYLYLEKRRGYALNSVANFHLKNGAVMWRLNWKANLLARGVSESFGIMVNYRYFLEETEMRSVSYLEKREISASEQIIKYCEQAKALLS